jgi:hypothetical protein
MILTWFLFIKTCHKVTEDGKVKSRSEFKKDLQKSAWNWIFEKMNMQKYCTKGLKADINKFVEQQTNVPFTMRNIYKMLEIVVGTQSQRMDKAIIEVFDKLTMHYDDNRFNVEGWKTNSHYLINQRFILNWMVTLSYSCGIEVRHGGNVEIIEDLLKALCYITGDNYDHFTPLNQYVQYRYKLKVGNRYVKYNEFHGSPNNRQLDEAEAAALSYEKKTGIKPEIEDCQPEWGQWFEWAYFRVKAYKKGTMHFEFKDIDLWGKLNQHIARLKGYPLFEHKQQTKWQKKQNKQAA